MCFFLPQYTTAFWITKAPFTLPSEEPPVMCKSTVPVWGGGNVDPPLSCHKKVEQCLDITGEVASGVTGKF